MIKVREIRQRADEFHTLRKSGGFPMFKSPADLAIAIAEERRLHHAKGGLCLDVRIAERDGDETAIAEAKRAQEDGDRAWYEAWKVAKDSVNSTLETLGIDGAAIKMYL